MMTIDDVNGKIGESKHKGNSSSLDDNNSYKQHIVDNERELTHQ